MEINATTKQVEDALWAEHRRLYCAPTLGERLAYMGIGAVLALIGGGVALLILG